MLDGRKSLPLSYVIGLLLVTITSVDGVRHHHTKRTQTHIHTHTQHQQLHVTRDLQQKQNQQHQHEEISTFRHDWYQPTHHVTPSTHGEIVCAWVIRDERGGGGGWTYHSQQVSAPAHCTQPQEAVAWLIYEPLAHKQGWDVLSLATSSDASDWDQSYAAGYLEGIATHIRIAQLWSTIGKPRHSDVDQYISTQDTYLRERVATITKDKKHPEYIYWIQIGLILAQLDGMAAGYKHAGDPAYPITLLDFWSLQLDGDMLDIERLVNQHQRCDSMDRMQLLEFVSTMGHCSAMIRWTHDDLLVTHATWADYEELLKTYKHYRFAFHQTSVQSQVSSFSSYPGFIWSSDDFYVLDTGLVITETTINILNDDLYTYTPDSSVTAWIRTMVANRLSSSGEEWANWFARYNSGTYNCQWMIIDYNRFIPKSDELLTGVLWIVEQIPGRVQARDVTPLLATDGYWGSYNLPFFAEINEASMYQHYATRYGEVLQYKKSARAKILAREQKQVTSLDTLQRLSRFNRYTEDELSHGCPGEAIAARYDLPPKGICDSRMKLNGAVDAKAVSSSMVSSLTTATVLGPSWDDQPPFDWSHVNQHKPAGQPTRFQFTWILTSPRL